MMNLEQFYLLKLAEECSEVAQRALKQMQFGKNEIQKDQALTNSMRLRAELNDLLSVIKILEEMSEIPHAHDLDEYIKMKRAKLEKYLEYSRDLGLVG